MRETASALPGLTDVFIILFLFNEPAGPSELQTGEYIFFLTSDGEPSLFISVTISFTTLGDLKNLSSYFKKRPVSLRNRGCSSPSSLMGSSGGGKISVYLKIVSSLSTLYPALYETGTEPSLPG